MVSNMTAFGTAMLETVNGNPQQFIMSTMNGFSIPMDCKAFITPRQEEKELLDSLTLASHSLVLDWGCGIGRHLNYLRQNNPSIHCFGIDVCDLMLAYCRNIIVEPATFTNNINELSDKQFDLILLMGNNLGVFGNEQQARTGLQKLIELLHPEGQILIETGNPYGQGYYSEEYAIHYQGQVDGPFTWGYADENWITQQLNDLGCKVSIYPSYAPGNFCFFAIGKNSF